MLGKLLILGVAMCVIVCGTVFVSAQEEYYIPEWIKNTAGWWSNGVVSDSEFVDALQFLIDDEIISIQDTQDKTYRTLNDENAYQSVVLTTDKLSYKIGEDVIWTLKNVGSTDVYLYDVYTHTHTHIGIFEDDDELIYPLYLAPFYENLPTHIQANHTLSGVWNQQKTMDGIQDMDVNLLNVPEQITSGTYSIRTAYYVLDSEPSINPDHRAIEYEVKQKFYIEE
jgi:hypothetical protein